MGLAFTRTLSRAGGVAVQDEGGTAAPVTTLDFVGAGIAASVAGAVATVTVGSGGGFSNPMTTAADLIVGDTGGTAARLAKGTDGQVLTVDPTTHLLVWATPSGGGASFATPSIVLGSAAAAGAASTVIRSDSTIAAFDATAPSTQAIGDTAVVGSAAVATRRDHKHAMPAFGSGASDVAAGNHTHAGAGLSGYSIRTYVPMPTVGGGTVSWLNQGTATVTQNDGDTLLYVPGSAGDGWRLLEQTVPSEPWTIIACYLPLWTDNASARAGIMLRDNASGVSTGSRPVHGWQAPMSFFWGKYTSATTSAAGGTTTLGGDWPLWEKVTWESSGSDIDARIKVYYSLTGRNWLRMPAALMGFGGMTATMDRAGIGLHLNGSTRDGCIQILSWEVLSGIV